MTGLGGVHSRHQLKADRGWESRASYHHVIRGARRDKFLRMKKLLETLEGTFHDVVRPRSVLDTHKVGVERQSGFDALHMLLKAL